MKQRGEKILHLPWNVRLISIFFCKKFLAAVGRLKPAVNGGGAAIASAGGTIDLPLSDQPLPPDPPLFTAVSNMQRAT